MAITQRPVDAHLAPIVEQIARQLGSYGLGPGNAAGAKAAVRVEHERNVKRVVQVYWTPFMIELPGSSIGLHLEVAEPRVHWTEAYLTYDGRSWVLSFHERPDGEIQLAYYETYNDPLVALDGFFDISSWYVMTPTDQKWADAVYQIADDVPWTEYHSALASPGTGSAVQESLKKSTIIWLRYPGPDGHEITMPVWFLFDNKTSKIYVLSGERQQTLPGVERIMEATVIFRWKGKNARVADVPAAVRVLPPGPEWDEVAEKVAEKRLNIPGLPEETARRWRDECHILELTLLT
jgi:hypothetical protein